MALTELQLPNKAELYRDVQGVAGEAKSRALRWNEMSDFLNTITAADATAMNITDPQIVTDLAEFRASLNNIVAAIEAEYPTLDKVRRMLIL